MYYRIVGREPVFIVSRKRREGPIQSQTYSIRLTLRLVLFLAVSFGGYCAGFAQVPR